VILSVPESDTTLNQKMGGDFDLQNVISEVARHYLEQAPIEAMGYITCTAELIRLPNYQTFMSVMILG
jgi:hypothetical protein